MMTVRFYINLSMIVVVAALGCGPGGPEMGKVTGRVTFEGKPVRLGTVRFWPESGRPATGELDSEGRYELKTNEPGDGALVGKHAVTIEALEVTGTAPEVKSLEQEMEVFSDPTTGAVRAQRIQWLVPERYSSPRTSQLSAVVQAGENTIDFPLTRAAE